MSKYDGTQNWRNRDTAMDGAINNGEPADQQYLDRMTRARATGFASGAVHSSYECLQWRASDYAENPLK